MTIMGPISYMRSRYECAECGETRYPATKIFDVVGTGRTPGLRRMMARAGSRQPFKEAKEDLLVYAGIEVSAKDVERVAEKDRRSYRDLADAQRQTLLQTQPR